MRPPDRAAADNAALLTDLYQLTMLQAYHEEGMAETAVFDLFVRRLRHRNYLLACGLDTVLQFLEALRFSRAALDYLDTLGLFDAAFLSWLEGFRFTGDVYALPEGTPAFADEPLLQVVAPITEAQLVETYLLNQITFQTGIASKARRVVHAAQGRPVADFGMRRMHGEDATLKGARAAYLAGVASTSNVLAGWCYGIPVTGTMAHSYIEAHDAETEAFRAFAARYAETTLLVDTYDTVEGIRRVVALAREMGDAFQVHAVRLDSGDLAALAHETRHLLDAGGLEEVRIFVSGSLDEHRIAELLAQGAPIDGFGVGTRMGTMADQPYLDSAYKLAEYAGRGRMKLSAQKASLPGRKQVYRYVEGGEAVRDVLTTWEEAHDGEPLLQCVMREGTRTEAGRTSLADARAHALAAAARLPERLHALHETDPPYPVEISPRLQHKTDRLRQELTGP